MRRSRAASVTAVNLNTNGRGYDVHYEPPAPLLASMVLTAAFRQRAITPIYLWLVIADY